MCFLMIVDNCKSLSTFKLKSVYYSVLETIEKLVCWVAYFSLFPHAYMLSNYLQLEIYPNHPETTGKYLQPTQFFPKLAITSLTPVEPRATPPCDETPIFALFFCYWLWTWLNGQESRISKRWQKPSSDHESQRQTVDPFSQF